MATRRHHSDKGHARPEAPPELDSWDELAMRVGVKGALYLHDPAVFSRIKIGRFDAQVEIGRGGFGIVFKAYDPKLKRWVALKVCLTRSDAAVEDLMNEAQVLAELDHPNIVAVLEPGEYEGSAFFAMPYIDGENVRQFAKRTPRPTWWEILDVFIDVASGLEAAHGANPPIVHGDVKPSNMLVNRAGFARIADFGLARRMIEDADESEREGLRHRAGTLCYMAPEVLEGGDGDARSDQFSFCVALYETLDGVLPFEGDTSAELLDDIEHTEVQFEDPSIPNRILALLRIGLSKNPSDRFPNMKTLRAELIRLRRSAPDESQLDEPLPAVDADAGPDEPPPSHETTPDKPPLDAPPPPLGEWMPDQPELTPLGGDGPAPSKATRGVLSASLVLAVGLTLGWLGRGRVEVSRPSDDPVPLPSAPCALGDDAEGSSVDIDPRVLAACTYIRQGRYVDADVYWTRMFTWRWDALQKSGSNLEDSPGQLAADTMIIVETYRDQAKRFARRPGKEDEAKDATERASDWTVYVAEARTLVDANESAGESGGSSVDSTN